jgi:hypothetical protein
MQINPILPEAANHLTSFDQQLDNWFYQINNNIEPLYQTFATRQDRNRFLVPYLYMKLYVFLVFLPEWQLQFVDKVFSLI